MFDFIMKDILGTPAILVGLFALFGLLLQKKAITDVVSGTLKTIMGFIILNAGATVLTGSLTIFGEMFEKAFNIEGVIPNNEAIVALSQNAFGTETAMIMLIGMIVNILLARYTKFKYIFLTGHHTMFMACLLAAVLSTSGMGSVPLVILGSLILGALMVLLPAMLQPTVREITGSDDIAVGHFGSFGYCVKTCFDRVGRVVNAGAAEVKVPKSLGFLRDMEIVQ